MSSESRPSWAGKKRVAPEEFGHVEQTKRRQNSYNSNNTTSTFQKGSDSDRGIVSASFSSANRDRRLSFNDGSRHKDLSPLTRSGTGLASSAVEPVLHSDDTSIRGRASEHSKKYDSDSRPYLSETAGMEGRLLSGIDTSQDCGPIPKDPEKNLVEDGPMKPAATGAFSKSSTPRVATTPRDSEAPSLPTNVSDMSKSLAKIFGIYGKGIVTTTQSISQNKAAKTRLRQARKADERWQARYGDFAALEEMQSKNLVSSEKKSTKCEKALDAAKKSHKHATTQIASVVAQSAHIIPPSRSSELQGAKEAEGSSLTIERIKADMTRLRGEFEKLATHAQRADFVVGKQKRLEDEFDALRTGLEQRTDRLEHDKVSFSAVRAYDQDSAKLKLLVSKAEAMLAKLEKPDERVEAINKNFDSTAFAHRIDGLNTKVGLLENTRLDDRVRALESKTEALESRKYDVEQARADNEALGKDLKDQIVSVQAQKTINETTNMQFTELKKELSQQTSDISRIKEDVYGDGDGDSDEASLLAMIKQCQDDGKNFINMFNKFDDTMDEHQASIDNLKARLKGFKDKLATSLSNPTSADSQVREALVDIDQLKRDMARVNKEQELKDDIVSKEVDRVDQRVIKLEDTLDELSNRVNEVQSRNTLHEDDPHFTTRSAQQVNERADKIDERLTKQEKSSVKILEDINALNLQLRDLSLKGLNSELPSDEIKHLHGLLTQHRGLITDLNSKFDTLWSPNHRSHSAAQSPHPTNGIMGAKGLDVHKIEALESGHKVIKQEVDGLQSNFQHFKQLTTDTTNTHETFIESLRQRFDNLTTDRMIKHMIYHLQSIWPDHPANVGGQLIHLHQRQAQTENDVVKALAQLRELDANSETQRHQIVLRSTEQKNLLDQVRKEFQQRNVEQLTVYQKANEDFQRRNTEQMSLIEQAKEGSERRDTENLNLFKKAIEDFQLQKAEQSRHLEQFKIDVQQQNRVLSEEIHEKYTILEQDVRNHLGRIQNLQKGLQSLRTDHTTSIADLWKTLKDAQIIIQSLGPTHTNGSTTNAVELDPIKSSLETTQKRLDDVWDNFLSELATTHSILTGLQKNIEALNEHCGIEGKNSPPTSHQGTAATTPFRNPNETNNSIINLEDEEESGPSSHNLEAPLDSQSPSPAQQLAVRGGSLSLGQPSSPAEPVSASQKRDDGSSDSEPVVQTLKRRKRRRGRPSKDSVENSPRARKSSRIS